MAVPAVFLWSDVGRESSPEATLLIAATAEQRMDWQPAKSGGGTAPPDLALLGNDLIENTSAEVGSVEFPGFILAKGTE
jgi:hypothetical protein